MSPAFRWPVAVVSLGLGAAIATVATGRLQGQATVPVPPPLANPAVVSKDLLTFREVVKQVVPAVVSIEARATGRPSANVARRVPQLPPGVPEEFRRFFEVPDGADGPRDTNLGFGSGVVVDPAGVILTNYHVVEGADELAITAHDGRKFTTKDIRKDPKTDLAVVRVTTDKPLPALAFGDSDVMEVGDRVLAVGAPFGLTGSVTHGIVSGKSRQNLKLNQYEDFIQTDAAINPGNSGGPLVSLDGKIIGINSAIKTRSGGFQGVGLAISSNLAKDVVNQLLKDGVVRRGYLGVAIRELDDALAERLGVARDSGVVVSKVYDRSPGAKAGLQAGDVITAIAGTPIKDLNTLPRLVSRLPLNQETDLTYVRDGKPNTVKVTILEQPDEYGVRSSPLVGSSEPKALQKLGLTVTDLTPEQASQIGYPRGTRGALITAVATTGPAADAGLVRGRVVIKVDNTPVESAKGFADAVAAADADRGVLLHVLKPSGEVDFAVLKVK